MAEWLKSLLAAIGGGAVVLVGVLTIFKNLFLKLFETGIESSFEKNLEMYRNKLSRSTKAFEILLDREMRFYERMESLYAELVPLQQDLIYYAKRDEEVSHTVECDAFHTHFVRYAELIKEIKNETLMHQSYIPQSIFTTTTAVVGQMQADLQFWLEVGKAQIDGKYDSIDYKTGQEKIDVILTKIVKTQLAIKKRLEELSQLS